MNFDHTDADMCLAKILTTGNQAILRGSEYIS